jgi:hypothetical protein
VDKDFVPPETGTKRQDRTQSLEDLTEQRRSKRQTIPPRLWWEATHFAHVAASVGEDLPTTYREAMESVNMSEWSKACEAELK